MEAEGAVRITEEGLLFAIRVQPRAARCEMVGLHGDAFKLRLTAPPVEGAANRMCIQYLSEWLRLPKTSLHIRAGQRSRTKTILCRWQSPNLTAAQKKAWRRAVAARLLGCE